MVSIHMKAEMVSLQAIMVCFQIKVEMVIFKAILAIIKAEMAMHKLLTTSSTACRQNYGNQPNYNYSGFNVHKEHAWAAANEHINSNSFISGCEQPKPRPPIFTGKETGSPSCCNLRCWQTDTIGALTEREKRSTFA